MPTAPTTPTPESVLLFYDGFERRCESRPWRRLAAELRRGARFGYRTLLRKQTRTGFYTAFLLLVQALERHGSRVRINDFAFAKAHPELPIGAAGYPTVLEKLEVLDNPRLVGPGLYASPLENPELFADPRNRLYLQCSAWIERMFAPWYGDRQRRWFAGLDLARFPDTRDRAKGIDVLIYDKIYFQRDRLHPETIGRFEDMLRRQGLSWTTLRYGQHHYGDFQAALAQSRAMAYFSHSETQGMACQEGLACNVPVFAWDEGVWPHPHAAALGKGPVACTSVPYFDERCGVTFTATTMLDAWPRFWAGRDGFAPRAFVRDELSLERSAGLYLRAYAEAGDPDGCRGHDAAEAEAATPARRVA